MSHEKNVKRQFDNMEKFDRLYKQAKERPIEITLELVKVNAEAQVKKYIGSDDLNEMFITDQAIDTLIVLRHFHTL